MKRNFLYFYSKNQDGSFMKTYFIIGCIFLSLSSVHSNDRNRLYFQHFPLTEQLPSNSVSRLYNDKEGYMWFGTKDGLCQFDGYGIKVFRSNTSNPDLLTNNSIQCIAEDNNNKLWIGTIEGINILDKNNYSIKSLKDAFVRNDRINAICIDQKNNAWVATNSNGIIRFDTQGNSHQYLLKPSEDSSTLKVATCVYEDRQGRIWGLFWNNGIALYDVKNDSFQLLPPLGTHNNPFRIIQDNRDDNLFWICTWGDGIFSMNLKHLFNNPFSPCTYSQNGKSATINPIVYSMVQDTIFNYIWAVTYSGLCVLEKKDDRSFSLIETASMFKEPTNNLFHEIILDRRGNLWLGSVGEGIYTLDFNRPIIRTYPLTQLQKENGVPPNVFKLCTSESGQIYLGIDRLGLYLFDPKTNRITHPANREFSGSQQISVIQRMNKNHEIWFTFEDSPFAYAMDDRTENASIRQWHIGKGDTHVTPSCFFEDIHGNIWIGTDNGLYEKPLNKTIQLAYSSIQNIVAIGEDKNNNIWVGTEKQGLFKLKKDKDKDSFSGALLFNKKMGNLQSNSIQSVCCCNDGSVYAGAAEGSIYLYNEKSNTMTDINKLYGITDDGILNILEDDTGMLWISTAKKIIRFNPESHVVTYYTQSDGILVNSFSKDACEKLQNGMILFGGNNGLCEFYPENEPVKSNLIQRVAITNIEIQNQSIYEKRNSNRYDLRRQRITLSPNKNTVSFEFSALNYIAPEKIQYAYQLEGVDKEWIYTSSNRRFVNYANLLPGKYTFKIKATDEYGSWNDQFTSLTIIKLPFFYQTGWAYLLYALLLLGIGYFIYYRLQLKHRFKISQIEKEKSEELAQTKLRYFTNISHDILTPLTIISILANEIREHSPDNKPQLDLIASNLNRLQRLIKQILTFRSIDAGNIKLKVKQDDIVAFIRESCYTNFQPLIKKKQILFTFESQLDNCLAFFDHDKLDKILYNLLSNAFKYTPSNGLITVKMTFLQSDGQQQLLLSVQDTGIGIDEKDLPHIFTRFFISDNSDLSQSNGIGLSLTKDLVQLHKGAIQVTSKRAKGTTFIVTIPVSREAFSEDEIGNVNDAITDNDPDEIEIRRFNNAIKQTSPNDCNLLIVEDDMELKQILNDRFSSQYTVFTADDGLQALAIIKKHEINLIITDVIMPNMDGIALCEEIKSNLPTSHIDVILLTAKISAEDQMDCYNAGADAYVPKPFDLQVLEAVVKNLIRKRQLNAENFKASREINISSMHYNSVDEDFLHKCIAMVELHINDDAFDFEKFAYDMNSSRSTLHRKLKSLTGLSPWEFIRNIRLKQACNRLLTTTDPISEVAYAVGFKDPKYFSSSFKSEFGMTPREYREKIQTV